VVAPTQQQSMEKLLFMQLKALTLVNFDVKAVVVSDILHPIMEITT
jgi:hypothetical protein